MGRVNGLSLSGAPKAGVFEMGLVIILAMGCGRAYGATPDTINMTNTRTTQLVLSNRREVEVAKVR